jgi:hypothetical protein
MILTWLMTLLLVAVLPNDSPNLLSIAASRGIRQVAPNSSIFFYAFVREGQRRETLVLTPGAVFEIGPLQTGPRSCVSLLAAMPWNLGDGADLKISIVDGAQQRQAADVYLDPAHQRAHRAWIPIRLDVPQSTDHFTLRFEVGPGPRGDLTGDWIGVAPGPERGCLFAAN